MARMTDDTLITLVNAADADAVQFSGEFNRESEKALEYYLGLPFGDEEDGRSSLISTDVQDVVEADMPSLVRTFLGSNSVMKFEPHTDSPEDRKEAEQKTKYINWLIRHQPESFATLHGWMKDAEIQKVSVVKYFIEDTLTTTEHKFENISEFELVALEESLKGEDVKKIDVVESTEQDEETGEFDVTFKVTKGQQKLQIVGIAPEAFRVSRLATSIEDAELVGDDEIVTRGELLSQGFSKKLINKLLRVGGNTTTNTTSSNSSSNLKSIRFNDEDGDKDSSGGNEITDWASEEVRVENRYVKIDRDGDGVAERRFIRKSGSVLLSDEAFNHEPYAALSAILMPHKLIGRSRAELVMETQRSKSVMLRGAADNTYAVNNPRIAINENINVDDMTTIVLNGIIRSKGETNPGQNMFPVEVPFIGDKALLMLNYLDQQRTNRTGALATSQGLAADDLNQETATRFNGIESAGKEKIELVARVFAETGWRKLFEGVAWTVSRFQNTEIETMILGEALTVNPADWEFDHSVVSEVGLAISDNEESISTLTAVSADQLQLQAQGSELVDSVKIYNVRQRLIKATGLGNVQDFYNNPEVETETLQAENELMRGQLEQLTQQLQASANPLAEAEAIKREGDIAIAEGKLTLEAAKLESKDAKDQSDAIQEQQKIDLAAQDQRFNQVMAQQSAILEAIQSQAQALKTLQDAAQGPVIGPGTQAAVINQTREVIEAQQGDDKLDPELPSQP
jgi:hypothetical protein